MKTIAVIGGGASGIMAALTAAEDRENRVLLFERHARLGRKLMATGNGRCNLTNSRASLRDYHGEGVSFAAFALESFSPADTLAYFRSLGLITTEEPSGRVYPLSDAAGSVLDTLRFALAHAGVEIRAAEPVLSVTKAGEGFSVNCESGKTRADAVIIACGGMAGGKLGGVKDGYELLKSFGHHCTKLYPSLVPITTVSDYPRSLKGIRADAAIALMHGGEDLAASCGEIQFTETGVSGPAAFEISRAASTDGGELVIDFLRGYSAEEIRSLLLRRRELSGEAEVQQLFTGILLSRIGTVLAKDCGIRPSSLIGELSDSEISALARKAKDFHLPVKGTGSFDVAQVTAGGILTGEFNPRTMESRLVPGLYACGEVLDIDGDCGGFNLQWAWSSGRLAGRFGR